MDRFPALLLLLLVVAPVALAQRTDRASAAELDTVTARGRTLHAQERAVAAATTALVATRPQRSRIRHAIAQREGRGWRVAFGRLDPMADAFAIAYLATQTDSASAFSIEPQTVPVLDSGYCRSAARAIELTTRDFKGIWGSYTAMVLPTDSSRLLVYHVPTQLETGVFVLGADVRYLVSPDGATILEKRELHRKVWEFPPDSLRERKIVPLHGMHQHLVEEAPVETDVLHVLSRTPAVDELIVTRRWIYGVKPDGRATYVTTTDRFGGR